MHNTVTELFKFQELYLENSLSNIPEERLYEKQLKGYNSAGWILGHLIIEAEDVFNYLEIPYEKVNENWTKWFKNSSGEITNLEGLPTKEELLKIFKIRYETLCRAYENLSSRDRFTNHPSKLLENHLPNLDAWCAHHLTTHIAIHCGNIVVWKKIIGLNVEGY
jgi:hypothetical protein